MGEREAVGAALVLDLDPALLDLDVRLAVLPPHGAELDEVAVGGGEVLDGPQDVQGALDVVAMVLDRVLAVDHRVGGALRCSAKWTNASGWRSRKIPATVS